MRRRSLQPAEGPHGYGGPWPPRGCPFSSSATTRSRYRICRRRAGVSTRGLLLSARAPLREGRPGATSPSPRGLNLRSTARSCASSRRMPSHASTTSRSSAASIAPDFSLSILKNACAPPRPPSQRHAPMAPPLPRPALLPRTSRMAPRVVECSNALSEMSRRSLSSADARPAGGNELPSQRSDCTRRAHTSRPAASRLLDGGRRVLTARSSYVSLRRARRCSTFLCVCRSSTCGARDSR
jgi:hypothetical protein